MRVNSDRDQIITSPNVFACLLEALKIDFSGITAIGSNQIV
jgi:hypothetical protein